MIEVGAWGSVGATYLGTYSAAPSDRTRAVRIVLCCGVRPQGTSPVGCTLSLPLPYQITVVTCVHWECP